MTWRQSTMLCLLAILLASCGENKPPEANGNGGQQLSNPSPVAGNPSVPAVADDPMPPDALFTLSCQVFSGPNHFAQAENAKLIMRARTGWREWHVLHTADSSTLFYGYYHSFDDRNAAAEYQHAQTDRLKVTALQNDLREPLFAMVFFVPLDTSDPPAPKEWEVTQCPGFWTLLIGAYRDNPSRKQAAVDAVKAARAMGIDAYYHHGTVSSEVYIGHWPREAVKEQNEGAQAHTEDRHQTLIVYTNPVSDDVLGKTITTPDGQKPKVVAPQLDIVDPTLKKAIDTYPNTLVNGVKLGRRGMNPDGSPKVVYTPSFLIQVPHETAGEAAPPPMPDLPNALPDQPTTPGADRLKSIGG